MHVEFIIPSETFKRMAKCAGDPNRPFLYCVRLEYRKGRYYVITSNSWVMAVQYLGDVIGPDAAVNVTIGRDDWMAYYSAQTDLVFNWYPGLALTVNGHNAPFTSDNEPKFAEWWNLFPDALPRVDKGFLYFHSEYFQTLCDTSPTGHICMPEVIDNTKSVICRDSNDPSWVGLFVASDKSKFSKPATRPEWLP